MRGLPFHVMKEIQNEVFDDTYIETTRECMRVLIEDGSLHKRSELRKMDTIDLSAYGEAHCEGDIAALPMMYMSEENHNKLKEYWCFAIPPLLNGVLRINKNRFIGYEVLDIDMEEKSYLVRMMDYAFDKGVWTFNLCVVADINCVYPGGFRYDTRLTMREYFMYMFVSPKKGMHTLPLDKRTYDNLVNDLLPSLEKEVPADDEMTNSLIQHFFTAMLQVNCELNEHKPKAVRGKAKGVKVKTVTDKTPETNPRPQIVRTLPSGVTITSAKAPKASTLEVVRHYKVASWNVRGHVRHYKNGKVVYIEPRVAHRKEFGNATNVGKRQTIIVSERKGI